MEYKIKNLGKLRIVGIKERIHTNSADNHNSIPELWQNVMENGMFFKLMELNDGQLTGCVGVCCNYAEDGSMDYYVGVDTTQMLEDCVELEIEEAQYAVFECTMTNIQETWRDIFEKWLPTVEYQFCGAPSIEHYPDKERCEIYIPLEM